MHQASRPAARGEGDRPLPRRRIDAAATPNQLIEKYCSDILTSPGMSIESQCIQHGDTTVLEHSAAVTACCALIARALRVPVDERALMRGALLHDYFLYDWHVYDPSHRLHGFTHPGRACKNAIRDFGVGRREQSMIRHHMFPLTPTPPTCREGAILCVADKIVATGETVHGFALKLRARQRPREERSAR